MKIIISGATGFIGNALRNHFESQGYVVYSLSRNFKKDKNNSKIIYWNPSQGILDAQSLEGMDVIINLSGENIGAHKWTQDRKQQILKSRVETTFLLCKTISSLDNKPKVFLNASAVGYYGNRGDELLDETSRKGSGFLSDVCQAWESATDILHNSNLRLVIMRFGVVLDAQSAALKKMILPFRMGFGGRLGDGNQYISWISLVDVIRSIDFIIKNPSIEGPVNITSPKPITNSEFTKCVGKILKRPTFFSIPTMVLEMIFGEMAQEAIVSSTRAIPKKLLEFGYKFEYENIQHALESILLK